MPSVPTHDPDGPEPQAVGKFQFRSTRTADEDLKQPTLLLLTRFACSTWPCLLLTL